jgi:hypothetical protein
MTCRTAAGLMADDHVGLWVVVGCVEDQLKRADESKIRSQTIELLYDLLRNGEIEAGFPDSNGRDFHVWPFPAKTVIDYIESRWKQLGARPKPGEIAWFTAPISSAVVGHSP